MAVVNNEALSFDNMSSATVYQYKGTSKLTTQNWWIGYYNSSANHNLCIKFTPSTTLSKVVFRLTAYSYVQDGSNPCYYYLSTSSSHPGLTVINNSGTSFIFSESEKIANITLNQIFTEGTTYYLWIAPTSEDAKFRALVYTSDIVCVTDFPSYPVVYLATNGNGFLPYQSYIFNNNSWSLYNAYIYTNGTWVECASVSQVSNPDADIAVAPV